MRSARRGVVLLFPGQGAQYVGMARGLYGADQAFGRAMDAALDRFPDPGSLRDDWLRENPQTSIDDVTRAQPLLFAVEYALGRILLDRGLRPVALLGHSVGEVVAATLAGVFSLDDAVVVMQDRVSRIASTPAGGMVALPADEEATRTVLDHHPEVALAAVNAPRQTMISGFTKPLRAAAEDFRSRGFVARKVACRQAFHHPALAPLFEDLRGFASVRLASPQIALWSAFTGGPVDGETARDPVTWAGQPAAPVYFWPTLDRLLSTGRYLLVETGPRQGLATVARRHPEVQLLHSRVAALLPARPGEPGDSPEAVAGLVQRIRAEGHPLTTVPAPAGAGR